MELAHRYRKGGSELILFIHGIGCSKESFEQVWGIPEFEKYSLLTVDLAGHGDSPRPAGFSYSMEAQADACMHLLQSFEFDRIHIVGHSMGGAVALLLAGKLEDKLGSFVSAEGNLIGADCGLVTRKTISYDYDEFEKVKFGRFVESNEISEDTSLKLWAGMLRKCSPLAFYKCSESLVEWSDSGRLLELFLRLNSRKAYIHGDRNLKTDVIGMLKGIEKISVSGSGHFIMTDNPVEFYKKLYCILEGENMDASKLKRQVYPMPEDVEKALKERGLTGRYEKRPPYQQNDYIGWITRARRQETREKRISQMLDELESGKAYMGMKYNAEI